MESELKKELKRVETIMEKENLTIEVVEAKKVKLFDLDYFRFNLVCLLASEVGKETKGKIDLFNVVACLKSISEHHENDEGDYNSLMNLLYLTLLRNVSEKGWKKVLRIEEELK